MLNFLVSNLKYLNPGFIPHYYEDSQLFFMYLRNKLFQIHFAVLNQIVEISS